MDATILLMSGDASCPSSETSERFTEKREEEHACYDRHGTVERHGEATQGNQEHRGGGWWM